jgi:hypothetical protein
MSRLLKTALPKVEKWTHNLAFPFKSISMMYGSSPDGEHWTLVTSATPWPGRYWLGYAAYDGKLWIFGGFRLDDDSENNYGNRNDVWFSADGVKWWKQQRVPWAPRHAMLHWVANDSLWISSGYSGGGNLHNDMWRLQRFRRADPSALAALSGGGSATASEVITSS